MRELYAIQQHADVGLAATAALLTAHQSAKVVDDNAVMQLSAYLQVHLVGCGAELTGVLSSQLGRMGTVHADVASLVEHTHSTNTGGGADSKRGSSTAPGGLPLLQPQL